MIHPLRIIAIALATIIVSTATAGPIVIGQVASYVDADTADQNTRSGHKSPCDSSQCRRAKAAGPYIRLGLQTYINAVNNAGGVHGATLKFVSQDRGLDVAGSVAITRQFIAKYEPVALAGLMGTGPMKALVESKVLEDSGIPVVGIRTGAVSLHEPVNPYLFHTRASYRGEAEKIVQQLATVGLRRIAVFYEKSAFGEEGLRLVRNELKKHASLQLIHHDTYPARTTNVGSAAISIRNANPQSVIVIANSPAAAEFYKAFRAAGGDAQVIAISTADGGDIVKRIGKTYARGLIVTQVVPDVNREIPLIRELKKDIDKFAPPGTPINLAVVEGYIAAKTLVEALRNAGPNPTREKVRRSLESMKEFDAGGLIIGFSPNNHSGSKYVELAIVLASGQIMR